MPEMAATLLRPEALWLALLIIPAVWLAIKASGARGDWSKVIDPELLSHLLQDSAARETRRAHWLVPLGLVLAILGIAGPSFSKIDVPVFQRADALVIVLDLSASMSAADIQPSRVQRARQKILDILSQRNEGVTGLVVYAGDAHVVAPLTDDRRTIENLLPALDPAIMPLPGSNPTAALEAAIDLLAAAGVANGQLLLLTDGMPKFEADDIAGKLQDNNASIAILAIGTAAGAPIPRTDGGFLRSDSGEIVIPNLDSDGLRSIANQLSGRYAEVSLDNTDLDQLLVNPLLDDSGDLQLDRKTDTWLDQGNWIALLLAACLLPLFRRGALAVVFAAPLFWSHPAHAQWTDELWRTPDQRGAQALEAGNSEQAAKLFQAPSWRGVAQYQAGQWVESATTFDGLDTADGWYNKGNALAKAGAYQDALNAYDRSLAMQPDQQDAVTNRDIVRQLLEQQEDASQDQNDQNNQGEEGDQNQPSDDQSGNGNEQENSDSQQQSQNQSDSENSPSQQNSSDSPSEGSEAQSDTNQQNESAQESAEDLSEEMRERLQAQTQEQMGKFDEGLEKQQALEQWMRRVPDDPGGLLQRKFRYETIQRMRRGEDPDNDVRW
ncbi:MAG: VWA domain-containing protein [Proteobacteria bacterium]|nr:VWA domain-containing protein [Pseudomonadota bacterium]